MTLTELIHELQTLRNQHGDLTVLIPEDIHHNCYMDLTAVRIHESLDGHKQACLTGLDE